MLISFSSYLASGEKKIKHTSKQKTHQSYFTLRLHIGRKLVANTIKITTNKLSMYFHSLYSSKACSRVETKSFRYFLHITYHRFAFSQIFFRTRTWTFYLSNPEYGTYEFSLLIALYETAPTSLRLPFYPKLSNWISSHTKMIQYLSTILSAQSYFLRRITTYASQNEI